MLVALRLENVERVILAEIRSATFKISNFIVTGISGRINTLRLVAILLISIS